MTSKETVEELAHIENVMYPLHDDTLVDPVIRVARQALGGGSAEAEIEDQYSETASLKNALKRAEAQLARWKALGDLRKVAQGHWAIGLTHLALQRAESALEHLQISSEMAEAHGDKVTRAWALAYHGLTKIALFDELKEEGAAEVEEAKRMLEGEDNMLGACAISERMRSMMF